MIDYIAKIEKIDGRTKSGLRLIDNIPFKCESDKEVLKMKRAFAKDYPKKDGYRIEVYAAYRTARNVMSGEEIQVAVGTPLCCDPSSETYWSM